MGVSSGVKQKTATNVLWLFVRYGGSQLVRLTLGVIVARILAPENYTVMGLIVIFVSLAAAVIAFIFGICKDIFDGRKRKSITLCIGKPTLS